MNGTALKNTQAAGWVTFVDTELLCGLVLQPSWIIRQRRLSLSLLLLLSAAVSLLPERGGGDRGLFTLQSPLHFLSFTGPGSGRAVCWVFIWESGREMERNDLCLSGTMACLCPCNGFKERGDAEAGKDGATVALAEKNLSPASNS